MVDRHDPSAEEAVEHGAVAQVSSGKQRRAGRGHATAVDGAYVLPETTPLSVTCQVRTRKEKTLPDGVSARSALGTRAGLPLLA